MPVFRTMALVAMKRLMDKEKWDRYYEKVQERSRSHPHKGGFKTEGLRKYFCSYSDYLLFNVILRKYVPKIKGAKVLEVGSAPGDFLVTLNKVYGFIPYGVEYSHPGVVQTRELFSANNIDPDNVIYTDFFDETFHQKFRGYFDIVISRGFIEHFTDVKDVIEKHLNVLAEDGCLIVSIPNFNRRSLYGACASLFNRDLLETHNLDIMTKDAFAELFDRKDLCALFCGYYGTLRLTLVSAGNIPLIRLGIRVCRKLQVVLNPIFHLVFRDRGFENRVFSPFLLYIGLKRKIDGQSGISQRLPAFIALIAFSVAVGGNLLWT